jgi:hypothetical protein
LASSALASATVSLLFSSGIDVFASFGLGTKAARFSPVIIFVSLS